MRLEWIDDILAVLDSGSLAHAAERRMLTQSAFTRRVRTIEENIGATLFDRRRKPVSLMPGVQELDSEMREISARLHKLRHALKATAREIGKPLSFVCQHALTTTISPQVVRAAKLGGMTSVQVRSGDKDECLMQLLSKDVDLAIMYSLASDASPDVGKAFDSIDLGNDVLIPVRAPALQKDVSYPDIPTITYPTDAFLGQVFARSIRPRLPTGVSIVPVAETSLTLAMLQLVRNAIGIAWLPQTLVAESLEDGSIVRIDDILPAQTLTIKMLRLNGVQSEQDELNWINLAKQLQI